MSGDPRKRLAWGVYVVIQARTLGCAVFLVVLALDDDVATWAREPIVFGHPGFELRPIVLGPDLVPRITESTMARSMPALAVLSALMHAKGPDAFEVACAALSGLGGVAEENRNCYTDLILNRLEGGARRALEALMQTDNWEFQSDYYKRLIANAKAEGLAQAKAEGLAQAKAEGKAEGKAEAILSVLEGRGIAVDEATRATVMACRDLAQLQDWLQRAVGAERGTAAATALGLPAR